MNKTQQETQLLQMARIPGSMRLLSRGQGWALHSETTPPPPQVKL